MDVMEEQQQKLATIGRQAMNIQIIQALYDSKDGIAVIYNLENITRDEVKQLLLTGKYIHDSRILLTDPEKAANVFPHQGEAKKKGIKAYWKSCKHRNDFVHCECSKCGFTIEANRAIKYGSHSTDYIDVKYRFCPECGSPMTHKPEEGE